MVQKQVLQVLPLAVLVSCNSCCSIVWLGLIKWYNCTVISVLPLAVLVIAAVLQRFAGWLSTGSRGGQMGSDSQVLN